MLLSFIIVDKKSTSIGPSYKNIMHNDVVVAEWETGGRHFTLYTPAYDIFLEKYLETNMHIMHPCKSDPACANGSPKNWRSLVWNLCRSGTSSQTTICYWTSTSEFSTIIFSLKNPDSVCILHTDVKEYKEGPETYLQSGYLIPVWTGV